MKNESHICKNEGEITLGNRSMLQDEQSGELSWYKSRLT